MCVCVCVCVCVCAKFQIKLKFVHSIVDPLINEGKSPPVLLKYC